jgi:RNA polymerase sigma-70 factor (ECF subfamily)
MSEDQLRMIFACCHPSIAPDSRVALTLKIVGGFSVAEIASAYLSNEEAVAKMLTRAKARLRSDGVSMEIPVAREIIGRLDAVLKVLYLIFNEGYGASAGNELLRRDLCLEAIRLVEILSRHPLTVLPKVHAAAALFLFQSARFPARTNHTGELVLLPDQDRTLWDKGLAARGLWHMRQSAQGDEISTFHLEAEIAGIYTLAENYDATDWRRILECYDLLREISYSRIAELNRAVVVGQIEGAEAAIAALDRLADASDLYSYNLFHITRAHLLSCSGSLTGARDAYQQALSLTKNESVRRFISQRLAEL